MSNKLTARKPTYDGVTLVPMGDTNFFTFERGKLYGSNAFNGCVGVIIYGKSGLLIGHYMWAQGHFGRVPEPRAPEPYRSIPKAAANAIPRELAGKNLGGGVVSYIYAPSNLANREAVIAEIKAIVVNAGQPVPTVKYYTDSGDFRGAGFVVRPSRLGGMTVDWISA